MSVKQLFEVRELRDWLDNEYLEDIHLLRQEFAGVDRRDPTSLRGWFAVHPYLTNNDHARIAGGVSLRTIHRWRRMAGLPPAARRRPPGWTRPRRSLATPPDWRSSSWLPDTYRAGYGIRELGRAIHRSYTFTRRLLRRQGVAFRSARQAVQSRHPCCTRAWLVYRYVSQGESLTKCARLAGVSRATMTSWLLRHQIRVRSAGEQLAMQYDGEPGIIDSEGFPRRGRTG
jgi:hypothetical protein